MTVTQSAYEIAEYVATAKLLCESYPDNDEIGFTYGLIKECFERSVRYQEALKQLNKNNGCITCIEEAIDRASILCVLAENCETTDECENYLKQIETIRNAYPESNQLSLIYDEAKQALAELDDFFSDDQEGDLPDALLKDSLVDELFGEVFEEHFGLDDIADIKY